MYVRRIYNVPAYTQYVNNIYNRCANDRLVTCMSDTPAKRQAYSFAFPPDKKQAFTKIADEKYQRPASWLLLAAIDQVIANGGLLGEELPAVYASETDMSEILKEYVRKDSWDDLTADVADLRSQLAELKTTITTSTQIKTTAKKAQAKPKGV
jgi:hypothetical protein